MSTRLHRFKKKHRVSTFLELVYKQRGALITIGLSILFIWGFQNVNLSSMFDYLNELSWNAVLSSKTPPPYCKDLIQTVNDPSSSWSMSRWNLMNMAKIGLMLNGTYLQTIPTFLIGHERERGGMLGSSHDRPVLRTNITLLDFLQNTFNPKRFMYWYGNLEYFESIMHDNNGFESSSLESNWESFKILDEGIEESSENKESSKYSSPILSLLHPEEIISTHSTTISTSHTNSTSTSSILTPIEVILSPGNVLYIPPFWNYRVESFTLSLTLSIQSVSYIEMQFSKIYWHPLPFGLFQNKLSYRIMALKTYFSMLLDECDCSIELSSLALWLYNSRFKILYNENIFFNLHNNKTLLSLCPPAPPDYDDDSNTNSSSSNNIEYSESLQLIKDNLSNFQSASSNTGSLLKSMNTSYEIKRNFLGDYLEQLVRWAVGAHNTALYLKRCLA
eukprot:gene4618-9174_t